MYQAFYSARVFFSLMLRGSKQITPSGHVNTSVVESLKNQTQTVNGTCCFKRATTLIHVLQQTYINGADLLALIINPVF